MKVKEFDGEIEIEDGYWRNGGYGEGDIDNAALAIETIRVYNNKVLLENNHE